MDFRILGPLEVAGAGDGTLDVAGGKPRALLAILLLNAGEVVSTDALIDALWGEQPPATAGKALQVHVSQLRKALGAPVIATRPPGYVLELADAELDLDRFRRLHDEARALIDSDPERARQLLAKALALWRGPPLAEFAYEPFAEADIARLEEIRIAAVEDRVEADLALGRHAEVAGDLEALVARHPLRERLRAQQMLALYRSGRQAEALDAYRAARAALTEELGIEPGRELRELQDAILRQAPELDHRRVVMRPPDTFVGRDAELAEIGGALAQALAGRGGVVLLSGEPGIGKSRLADELTGTARDRGVRVLVGRCWEAGGAPAYWPWVQALRAYVREAEPAVLRAQLGRDGADVATILPEVADLLPERQAAPASDSEGARFRLMEALAAFLRSVAAAGPVVIFLDDLHAADAPSLLLLRYVAGQIGGAPILIAGCYRDTEVGPDLAEALAALQREPNVHRLALKGLSEPATTRLLAQTLGEGPADDLARQVQAETQGNPLFATEIGRLLASESPRREPGDRLPVPEGVRETIGRRLRRQSEGCQEALALASVMGREFDPEVVREVSGLDEDELFGVLDEAAAARLVDGSPEAGGRLRFSHILIRDALYEDLPAPRRLRLHRAVGDALEALFAANPDPHLAELAHHYLEGGTPVAEKAAGYARRAGDRAASQHGYEEAVRHYESALQVLDTTGSSDASQTCELLLSLGEVHFRAGSGQEARQALQRAAALAEEAGRPDQLARAALEYGGRFAWARASSDPGLVPLLERALAAIGADDSRTRVRLLARLAAATRDDPSRERRTRLGEEAVAIAERCGDPATMAVAIEGHWVAIEGPDLTGAGIGVGEKLIALGEQVGDRERVFAGHDHRLHNFWQLGDRPGVDVELDALATLADELRQPAQHWHVGTGRTMLALMEGRLEEAEELIAETAAFGRRAQSWNAVVTQRLALFVLRREQGRLAELEDTIERSVLEYPALLRFRCALAHLYGELGRERDARAVFDDLVSRDLANEHLDAEWLFSMTLLCEPCAFLADGAAAGKLYTLLLPYERCYAQAPVEAIFGSVARGLGVLATTLREFGDAERHFESAIEIEQKMGARPWLAHVRHDLAAMLLERGAPRDVERAGELLGEATATYTELGMEAWVSRADALSP